MGKVGDQIKSNHDHEEEMVAVLYEEMYEKRSKNK